jgi:hypothetical protein
LRGDHAYVCDDGGRGGKQGRNLVPQLPNSK